MKKLGINGPLVSTIGIRMHGQVGILRQRKRFRIN